MHQGCHGGKGIIPLNSASVQLQVCIPYGAHTSLTCDGRACQDEALTSRSCRLSQVLGIHHAHNGVQLEPGSNPGVGKEGEGKGGGVSQASGFQQD
eukprot:scaffold276362_cov18-Tisochrysis_lutea.AAC.2